MLGKMIGSDKKYTKCIVILLSCCFQSFFSTMKEEMSNLFFLLVLTSPCLELSYTSAATASVPQSCDPAKEKKI